MKSFKDYLVEETKLVTFAFGRFNPPSIGHEKVFDAVKKLSRGGVYRIYASKTNDKKKNPLIFKDKIKFMRKMFPKHARNIMADADVRTVFDIAVKLYDQGFTKVQMVVGSDRVREFDTLLNKYNGVKGRHGFYEFEGTINVLSAGERDPDNPDSTEGISASKLRQYALDGDRKKFAFGIGTDVASLANDLYNAVRKGMGLRAESSQPHTQLEKVSDIREDYVQEKIFRIGTKIRLKETGQSGKVIIRGSNYVIAEFNGKKKRCWLDSIVEYAGEWGTDELTKNYADNTPGQKNMSSYKKLKMKREHDGLEEDAKEDFIKLAAKGFRAMAKEFRSDRLTASLANKAADLATKGMDAFKKWFDSIPSDDKLLLAAEIGYYTKQKDSTIEKMLGYKFYEAKHKEKKRDTHGDKLRKDFEANPGDKDDSTDAKRRAQFNKQAEMDDDDPRAYKDAPGDKKARKKGLKPSKFTTRYKQMYGESMTFEDFVAENKGQVQAALKKKSKATGVSMSILNKVFDRGYAAWKVGHKPGTTPNQWGLARVNSFLTGGPVWHKFDSDQAKLARKGGFSPKG